MCLIIAAFQVSSTYPLIVAANREERRARPSSPPHLWPAEAAKQSALEPASYSTLHASRSSRARPRSTLRAPNSALQIWAGRDEVGGGTWLGVNSDALIAGITNRRRARVDKDLPSRGLLCLKTLRHPIPEDALEAAQATLRQGPSNPFNLFCANAIEGWVFDWRGKHWPLTPGIHLISNRGGMDDGRIGVVQRARALLADIDLTCTSLDRLLADLARVCANTEGRHPLCRPTGDFGTVSSSLIALGPNGRIAAYQHADGPPCTVSYQAVEMEM